MKNIQKKNGGGATPLSSNNKDLDTNLNKNYNPIMRNYKSRKGFTLAEVLITLGIIGVVAAITIPTLISNYKQKTLDNQFKKSYALINQALLNAQGQFGYIPKCYYPPGVGSGAYIRDCIDLTTEFLKTLKITKICKDKAYENGCIAEYKGYDDVLKEQHKNDENYDEEYWQDYANQNCRGFTATRILDAKTVYVLSDGTIIFFYTNDTCIIVAIDINGKNGPNKWGYDLYSFSIRSDGNYIKYVGDACSSPEEGGSSAQAMINRLFH